VCYLVSFVHELQLDARTYTVNAGVLPAGVTLVCEHYDGSTWVGNYGLLTAEALTCTFDAVAGHNIGLYISVDEGTTVDVTLYPQIEAGTAATDYEPFEAWAYDYDYPRGYRSAQESHSDRVVNSFLVPCGFRLEISGPATNPDITIGTDSHKLSCKVDVNQALVVDSRDRSIKIVKADGSEVNAFRYRDKKADVFATIPAGAHDITWNGDFAFSLTLYKERSEPLWT
jgi:hypothetical protein